jgi:uncharacterized Zn ribbon protein
MCYQPHEYVEGQKKSTSNSYTMYPMQTTRTAEYAGTNVFPFAQQAKTKDAEGNVARKGANVCVVTRLHCADTVDMSNGL